MDALLPLSMGSFPDLVSPLDATISPVADGRAYTLSMPRIPSPVDSPRHYRWIVDGHNLLLSTPEWIRLGRLGHAPEARDALAAWVESFGRAAGVEVIVVFDGVETGSPRNPVQRPHLRILFTHPPAEADDQIVLLAITAVRAGQPVCVVSSDRRTLGSALPEGARLISASAFRRLHQRMVRTPEKWVAAEDLDAVERHFLSRSPFASDRAASGADPDPAAGAPEDAAGPGEDPR